ncbi:hypothetical protein J6590_031882 [Homalodisca vitripennis]|nr:hypothetical protein J6590_031882 [Homalodisca vitripennis]
MLLTPLAETAKRTKALIENGLNKSVKRFKEEVSKVGSGEGKLRAEKKLNTILNELKLLKTLSEDEIISFALSTDKNLMAIASNRRAPQEQRMKARVASHKPLSTFLARVKSETADSFVDQLVPKELNKISLNNQIIRMRKDVKRAKVHVIHKLTRTIAMLRKSKGNEQLKAKHERKAERLTKKVKRIDELSEDEIAKFALTTMEDLNRLSTDIKIPMTTQAMATIAIHKFVAGPVEEYRKAFPDLPKAAPNLLKKKKRKNKFKIETKESSKDHNEIHNLISESDNRNNNINDSEELESDDDRNSNAEEENSMNDDDSMNSEGNESYQEDEGDQPSDIDMEENNDMKKINFNPEDIGDQQSDIDMDENISSDSENNGEQMNFDQEGGDQHSDVDTDENMSNYSEGDNSNEESGNSEIESIDEAIPKPIKKNNTKNKKPQSVLKLNKHTSTSKLNNEKNNISNDKTKVNKSKVTKETIVKEKPKVVDPFFVTVNNEEYLTSQEPVISEGSNKKGENNKFNSVNPTKFNRFDNPNKRDFREKSDWQQNKTSNRDSKWNKKEDDWRRNQFSKTGTNFRNNRFDDKRNNWQTSKFNQKKPITNHFDKVPNRSERFQGQEPRKERRKTSLQPFQEPKVEKLHPSWEAKKKQATVAAFQGKKITFD